MDLHGESGLQVWSDKATALAVTVKVLHRPGREHRIRVIGTKKRVIGYWQGRKDRPAARLEYSMADSVLAARVPHAADPVQPLVERFEAWRVVLVDMRTHFERLSSAEKAHGKELLKLADSVSQPFSSYGDFARDGSVEAIGSVLRSESDGRVAHSDRIVEALDDVIVPELHRAEESLKAKIQELSALSKDFKNNLGGDLESSKSAILSLQEAIAEWESNSGTVPLKSDPFLVDLHARKALRHSLGEEQYLHDSQLNLQQSAKALEDAVVDTIKQTLARYGESVSREASELAAMSQRIGSGIGAGQLDQEWAGFAQRQAAAGLFLPAGSKARTLESQTWQGKDHPATTPVWDRWLEKKSGRLSGYTTAFYIISPSRYMHEFKSNDLREDTDSSFSLYLPDCSIVSVSKEKEKSQKLVLRGKQVGGLHAEHDLTFRARDRADLMSFYAILGRAADKTFTISRQSAAVPLATGHALPEAPSEIDADDETPFKGPETMPVARPAVQRLPTGTLQTFPTAYSAAAAVLSQPTEQSSATGGVSTNGRRATSTYGSTLRSAGPLTDVDRDDHLKQAQEHSAAAGFMNQRILDPNQDLPYDREHGTASTLPGDEDFKPVPYDTSRRSSLADVQAKPKRQSSLLFKSMPGSPSSKAAKPAVKPPSRKATVTYGDPVLLPASPQIVEEVTESETIDNRFVSPWIPRPGEGTTGKLPASHFGSADAPAPDGVVVTRKMSLASQAHGNHVSSAAGRAPSRKMSLSDQIMGAAPLDPSRRDSVQQDLEPNATARHGVHSDHVSPYPAAERYRIGQSASRQGTIDNTVPDTSLAAFDVAPHMRIGTQSHDDRYKVGSRRGSRSASGVSTPLEGGLGGHTSLDASASEVLASRLAQQAATDRTRRRPPSRSGSLDLGDGASSPGPAFKIGEGRQFRRPPSRGSSLSISNTPGGGGQDGANVLTAISESFERDLAAAKGNQPGDRHIPGEYPQTPAGGLEDASKIVK